MYRYIYINTNVFSNMYVYTYVLAYRIYSRICVQVYTAGGSTTWAPQLEEDIYICLHIYIHTYERILCQCSKRD